MGGVVSGPRDAVAETFDCVILSFSVLQDRHPMRVPVNKTEGLPSLYVGCRCAQAAPGESVGAVYNDAMDTAVREWRKFFVRPAEPRSLRITARDIAILQNIGRFRLASTPQLAKLDGGSEQNVSRELLALFENGYVERPTAQAVSRRLYEGSRPTIHGLTRKGARLLRDNGIDVRRRLLDGIDKERGAGWRFIEHTVAITEFMVELERAAA